MEVITMSKVVLVTGGSRSGKSDYAEGLLKDTDDCLYIATSIVTDDEMADRIKRHRQRRNKNWETYEGFKDLGDVIEGTKHSYVLLDCITIMVTNLMFDVERDFDSMTVEQVQELEDEIQRQIVSMVEGARKGNKTLVIVTNEVGSGLVPEYKLGRIFRDIAGRVNQTLGKMCDEAYLVACSLPMRLK